MEIITIETKSLGDVLETHVHNDYVEFGIGDHVVLRAAHTPGHTQNHVSYVALVDGEAEAVFTGGSMLFGAVGRTDLVSDADTEPLTRAQFHSVRHLAESLPADASVHPAHGFGSFCSSSASSDLDASTIAQERHTNMACTTTGEDAFVEQLLAGLAAYPRYYAHMAPLNRQAPPPVDLSPPEPVDPVELRRRIHAGEWVVDLRDRKAFAQSHLAGTINVEIGDSFVTYLGWTIRWGTPVTLVGDTVADVAEAQRQLVRVGIDRPAGAATGGLDVRASGGELRSYRSATFDALTQERDGELVVLDVRRHDEWREGHIAEAVHIPLDELEARIDEVPTRGPVWVHCPSGFRASIAASLLDRAGRNVVAIHDDWEKTAEADLPLRKAG